MSNDTRPFTDGMDLLPLYENQKFRKSDFVIGRRFYVWHWPHGKVEIVTHRWGGMFYIERVVRCNSLYGSFTKEHVYCTPHLDRALAAAEFCTQEPVREHKPWDDPLGSSEWPEFPGE